MTPQKKNYIQCPSVHAWSRTRVLGFFGQVQFHQKENSKMGSDIIKGGEPPKKKSKKKTAAKKKAAKK